MARTVEHFVELPRECAYLPGVEASLEHRVMVDVSPSEWEALLVRGWRRFGPVYFRPRCGGCRECVSLRVVVADFSPSRSQRRARRDCASLRVTVDTPVVDDERLELYRAWHKMREQTRGWEAAELDERTYHLQFAFPHPSAREVAYWEERAKGPPRLVGLGLADETPNAWSAVYFFFHPAYTSRSLGTYNVVFQIEHARQRGIPHVYLGYRVEGCPSLRYKATFRPHELLVGWPDLTEEPWWQPASSTPSSSGHSWG